MKTTLSARAFGAALLVGMAVPATAQSTVATVTGKVLDTSGVAIVNATVSINELAASASTGPDGMYTLVINSTLIRGGLTTAVRARAMGFGGSVRMVRLVAGNQTVDFKLSGDGRAYAEVAAAGANVATTTANVVTRMPVAPSVAQGGFGGAQGSIPGVRVQQVRPGYAVAATSTQGDPFGRNLFTAEQVMQYQNAIALQESQRAELQKAVEEAQSQTTRMQWALAQDTEKLSKMLSETSLIEKDVMAQTDRIMAIEREIKRAQMMLMIKIKNTLTAEQQAKLRQLR